MAEKDLAQLLKEMEQYAEENHVPIIRSAARKRFCQTVLEAKPKRLLEIGTAIGYSALLALQGAAPGAELVTLEQNVERAALARQYWVGCPYEQRITLLEGDAGELLTTLTGKFDFVFIDAAKGQYPDYWRKLQSLLAPRVTVAADNVLFRGYVRGEVMVPRRFRTITKRLREYLELVQNMPGFRTGIYEDGDGLAVSRRGYDVTEA